METKRQQELLMIVRLSIHQWYPRKFDKKATRDLASLHGVSADRAGRFNKILVDLESIKPLQQRLRKLRDDHYAMTAPWADGGERVLPAGLYFDYVAMVRDAEIDIARLADDYVIQYSSEVDRARTELNGLFNEADYPPASELRERFGVGTKFEPLPNPEDVRVWGIGEEAAEEIRDQVIASQQTAVKEAQDNVVSQVTERAREFISKVRKYDAQVSEDVKGARLYDSALTNLSDVVGLVLQGLNITGDQELQKLAEDLSKEIHSLNADKLKNSQPTREKKTEAVEKIIGKFSGVYG
jgi:hypothetical protein